MRTQLDAEEITGALERQVEMQAEAAKRAIREYKKSLLDASGAGGGQRTERQRELEEVVRNYVLLRKKLDELCAETKRSIR
jgi:hypothetical protein